MNVQFLREHDGKPERVLKAQLIECFRRAYLAQTSSGDQLSVTLCLKTKHGPDESLVREIGAIFAGIFVVQEHLDILFLDETTNVSSGPSAVHFSRRRSGTNSYFVCMIDNLWDFYLFRGRVIIPTFASTESAWMHVEPVRVVEFADASAVTSAILDALRAGNPRRAFRSSSKSLVADHAGAKSDRAFEESARGWSLERVGDKHRIIPYRRRRNGGWEEDEGGSFSLPETLSETDIARRVVEILRAADAESRSDCPG